MNAGPLVRTHLLQFWSAGGGLRILAGWFDSTPPFLTPSEEGLKLQHSAYDPGNSPYPNERFLRPGDVSHAAGGFELFARDYNVTTYRERFWSMTLPLWTIIVTALGLPLRTTMQVWRSHWASHRLKHGLCSACGYDLRGSPDRCPECGRPTMTARPQQEI